MTFGAVHAIDRGAEMRKKLQYFSLQPIKIFFGILVVVVVVMVVVVVVVVVVDVVVVVLVDVVVLVLIPVEFERSTGVLSRNKVQF